MSLRLKQEQEKRQRREFQQKQKALQEQERRQELAEQQRKNAYIADALRKQGGFAVAKTVKKLDASDLLREIPRECLSSQIRSIDSYKNPSYNRDRQHYSFVQHLFVKYHVPAFLYKTLTPLPDNGVRSALTHKDHDFIFRIWFIALAQGEKFQNLVKPYLTRKESVFFLSGSNDLNISENIWLAKSRAIDIPMPFALKMINRLFSRIDPLETLRSQEKTEQTSDLLNFFAKYHQEIDRDTFIELSDFILDKLRGIQNFSFKNRTLGSLIRLSDEWHKEVLTRKSVLQHEWEGFNIPLWTYEENGFIWTVKELLSSKELTKEGQKQRHCVGAYSGRCANGDCSIFSARQTTKDGEEVERLTVEADRGKRIVQIRGVCNTRGSGDGNRNVRRWARENGFSG